LARIFCGAERKAAERTRRTLIMDLRPLDSERDIPVCGGYARHRMRLFPDEVIFKWLVI